MAGASFSFPSTLRFCSNQGRNWLVKRSYEDFRVLDKHLHLCIYDRRYSELSELPRLDALKDSAEVWRAKIRHQAWRSALKRQ